MIHVTRLAALLTLFPVCADAASCRPREVAIAWLQDQHKKQVTASGLTKFRGQTSLMEIFSSDARSFTVLITLPNGFSCLVADRGSFVIAEPDADGALQAAQRLSAEYWPIILVGTAVNRARVFAHAANALQVIEQIRARGGASLRQIAAELNTHGIKTARGGKWHATTARNIITAEIGAEARVI